MPAGWADAGTPEELAADVAVLQGLAARAGRAGGGRSADFTCPITAFGPVEAGSQLRTWGGCTTVGVTLYFA